MTYLLTFILHLDQHLAAIVAQYGLWTYAILFLIIFCESAIVLTPILPGESLLFAVGALSAQGVFPIHFVVLLLIAAAVLGGIVNYAIGRYVGEAIFTQENPRFINKKYLQRAQEFYEWHGGLAIVLARVIPIVRTFVPFVAGVVRMNYRSFIIFNTLGGILWIVLFTYGSFYFGNIPVVKANFSWVILGIIVVSLMPIFIELLRQRCKSC